MTRPLRNNALAPTIVLLACLGAGCGSSASVDDDDQPITCAVDTFRLVGTIDDMSIDVTQSPNYSGFDQLGSGEFFSIFGFADAAPSTYTDLKVTWQSLVANGGTAPATATVQIPTSPFPNDVFCAGQGSTVHMSSDSNGQITFHLASLASGAGCVTPRRGTLEACSKISAQ